MADAQASSSSAPSAWYDRWAGPLDKKRVTGMRGWQTRFFRIDMADGALSYYEDGHTPFPHGFIPLSDIVRCFPSVVRKKRFTVATPARSYVLRAESHGKCEEWVKAINTARLEHAKMVRAPGSHHARVATPSTPTELKARWTKQLPSTNEIKMSQLQMTFFKLNFSASELVDSNFFRDLRDDEALSRYLLQFMMRYQMDSASQTRSRNVSEDATTPVQSHRRANSNIPLSAPPTGLHKRAATAMGNIKIITSAPADRYAEFFANCELRNGSDGRTARERIMGWLSSGEVLDILTPADYQTNPLALALVWAVFQYSAHMPDAVWRRATQHLPSASASVRIMKAAIQEQYGWTEESPSTGPQSTALPPSSSDKPPLRSSLAQSAAVDVALARAASNPSGARHVSISQGYTHGSPTLSTGEVRTSLSVTLPPFDEPLLATSDRDGRKLSIVVDTADADVDDDAGDDDGSVRYGGHAVSKSMEDLTLVLRNMIFEEIEVDSEDIAILPLTPQSKRDPATPVGAADATGPVAVDSAAQAPGAMTLEVPVVAPDASKPLPSPSDKYDGVSYDEISISFNEGLDLDDVEERDVHSEPEGYEYTPTGSISKQIEVEREMPTLGQIQAADKKGHRKSIGSLSTSLKNFKSSMRKLTSGSRRGNKSARPYGGDESEDDDELGSLRGSDASRRRAFSAALPSRSLRGGGRRRDSRSTSPSFSSRRSSRHHSPNSRTKSTSRYGSRNTSPNASPTLTGNPGGEIPNLSLYPAAFVGARAPAGGSSRTLSMAGNKARAQIRLLHGSSAATEDSRRGGGGSAHSPFANSPFCTPLHSPGPSPRPSPPPSPRTSVRISRRRGGRGSANAATAASGKPALSRAVSTPVDRPTVMQDVVGGSMRGPAMGIAAKVPSQSRANASLYVADGSPGKSVRPPLLRKNHEMKPKALSTYKSAYARLAYETLMQKMADSAPPLFSKRSKKYSLPTATGSTIMDWLMNHRYCWTRSTAHGVCNSLLSFGLKPADGNTNGAERRTFDHAARYVLVMKDTQALNSLEEEALKGGCKWYQRYNTKCARCQEASAKFASYASQWVGGDKFSIFCSNIFMGLLLTSLEDVMKGKLPDCEDTNFNVFNKRVRDGGVWNALFTCIKGAKRYVQRHALKDVNGLLLSPLTGSKNCEDLAESFPYWQPVIVWLLEGNQVRASKAVASEDTSTKGRKAQTVWSKATTPSAPTVSTAVDVLEPVEVTQRTFNYTLNIFAVMHYAAFLDPDPFAFVLLFWQSYSMAMKLSDSENCTLPRGILMTMINRCISELTRDVLFVQARWPGLFFLLIIVKDFLFSVPIKTKSGVELRTGLHITQKNGLQQDVEMLTKVLQLVKILHLHATLPSERPNQHLNEDSDRRPLRAKKKTPQESMKELYEITLEESMGYEITEVDKGLLRLILEQIQWFKDTQVFISMMISRLDFMKPEEVEPLVNSFLCAEGNRKRTDVFKDSTMNPDKIWLYRQQTATFNSHQAATHFTTR